MVLIDWCFKAPEIHGFKIGTNDTMRNHRPETHMGSKFRGLK